MESKQLTIINLDWLQANCFPNLDGKSGYASHFEVKKMPYGTRHFSQIEEIFHKENRVCTVASKPYSPVIDVRTHLIKFDNYILYHANLHAYINQFFLMNNFTFNGFSRVDIACDFQNFYGEKFLPGEFIAKYCSEEILKVGKSKFAVRGSQSLHNVFEYLRFGTNTSEISYYLYDKTKELTEVKEKPHVRDAWQRNGLTEKNKNVWRLEFTLKSAAAKEMINESDADKETGEVNENKKVNLKNLNILKRENFEMLFFLLVQKYFQFVKNDWQKNKARMKRLQLFEKPKPGSIMFNITGKKESSRTDKIFIKKLHALNNELRGTDFDLGIAANEILYNYINDRQLEPWAMRKGLMPVGIFKDKK